MNEKESAEGSRETIIQNLYTWGPALTQEMKATCPKTVVLDLVRAKMITRKRFVGFDVYVLTGVGLRPYTDSD